MKKLKHPFVSIVRTDTCLVILFTAVILLAGCGYIPPSKNKADWFAVVEKGGVGKFMPVSTNSDTYCLEIKVKYWLPIIGPDGPGGPRETKEFWANLRGEGPVYKNPDLVDNDPTQLTHNRGSITIDRINNVVTIDLQRIFSKPGELEKVEPSRANGTYHLKRWIN